LLVVFSIIYLEVFKAKALSKFGIWNCLE